MSEIVHVEIIQGEDKGLRITVPPQGVRLGRSSKNDVVLADPLLSRYHCRLFIKDGTLWVADLGSANQSLVNGIPVQEQRLHVGDHIQLGDTVLSVLHEQAAAEPAPAAVPLAGPAGTADLGPLIPAAGGAPVVDLGLADDGLPSRPGRLGRGPLLLIGVLVVALALVAWVPKLLRQHPAQPTDVNPDAGPPATIELTYEKVEADTNNVFRYSLVITADAQITVEMDDVRNNRHFHETKALDPKQVQGIAQSLEEAGFFKLQDEYRGVLPNQYSQWDITLTLGRRTHRSMVLNRVEPEIFRDIRERIDVFGKNEMGLWAQQYTTEKMLEMAREAYLLGRKLNDERDVKNGNLALAIQSFEEAEFNLSTVEQKPDYYGDMLTLMRDCREELQKRYEDRNFQAEKAIRLKQWEEAARELRILCEIIPDRGDERSREARTKLLEIETRLKTMR